MHIHSKPLSLAITTILITQLEGCVAFSSASWFFCVLHLPWSLDLDTRYCALRPKKMVNLNYVSIKINRNSKILIFMHSNVFDPFIPLLPNVLWRYPPTTYQLWLRAHKIWVSKLLCFFSFFMQTKSSSNSHTSDSKWLKFCTLLGHSMAIISTNFDANLYKIFEVIVNYSNVTLQN